MRRREEIFRYIKDACEYKNMLQQAFDVARHKIKINTSWDDYYRFGFYKSEKSWNEKSLYIGEYGSRYWPYEGNSLKFDRIFALKSLQKSILVAEGLPTPEIVMKVGSNYPINSCEKFAAAMRDVKVPVISKFDGGLGGIDIYALTPEQNGFLCNGQPVDADWVWNKYERHIDRGFVIEARVSNHPLLAKLHPGSLNTLRLNTIKTADGKWHVLQPYLKIGRHNSHVDNISAGGLLVGLNEDGVARAGLCIESGTHYARHPDTGCQIEGFQVPHYREVVELALRASRTFGFMATIGWDIGVTENGPMIIEGNLRWGFKSYQEEFGPLLTAEIAAGLIPRSWWTPWDRTHMYPGYERHYAGSWWQRMLARRRRRWTGKLRSRLANKPKA